MKPPFLTDRSIRLESLFTAYGHRPALRMQAGVRTFGEVREVLRTVIGNLEAEGVRRGQRVALHAENSELHLYLFLASWVMDFLYLPLDVKAPPASLPGSAQVDLLITSGKASGAFPRLLDPDAIFAGSPPAGERDSWPAIPLSREASVIFTSGSTGRPRGLVHTVGNFVYSALGTNAFIGLTPEDSWLLSLPLHHVGGVLIWVRTLLAGGTCILPKSLREIDAAIAAFCPTVVSLVPTQLIRLMASREMIELLRGMKTVLLGGASPPAWMIEKALDLGIPLMPSYGSTESCAMMTGVPRGADRGAYRTAGQSLPYRTLAIAGDGTILVGGDTLFKRYFPEGEREAEGEGGLFRTADIGRFDREGNLVVLGRRDGVFISGGENIHPFEIENQLLALEGVDQAIVVPVCHREFGMVPWAFIETSGPLDEAALVAALRKRLPAYKVPKKIVRLDPHANHGRMKYSRESLKRMAEEMAETAGEGRG